MNIGKCIIRCMERIQTMNRDNWEVDQNESGDTQYLEREWSALEIEDMIDEAAEEAVPVDMFIRRRVV